MKLRSSDLLCFRKVSTVPENNKTISSFELTLATRPTVLITTGLIFLGFAFLYYETYNMMKPILPGYPGDAFFPRLAVGYTLIIAALIILRGILLPRFAAAPGEATHISVNWLEFLSVAALVLIYAQLLPPVGFELTTFVLMLILLVPRFAVQHGLLQSVIKSVALTIPTVLILYGVFALILGIHLPLLFLPRYI
jgi:hypothetical protein